jgi:putative tricarboxylic transport membrane protein
VLRQYSMGTATRMGPAYFPTTLGLVLVLIGFVVLARSFVQRGEPIQGLALKPMLLIIGATVLFGALLRGAGLLVALGALVMMSAWAAASPLAVALALAVGSPLQRWCSCGAGLRPVVGSGSGAGPPPWISSRTLASVFRPP